MVQTQLLAPLSDRQSRGLETVKLLAFLAMLLDHIDLTLFGRGVPWMHAVGRFAFPVFCITCAIGFTLTRSPIRAALRLVPPAIVASIAWHFLPGGVPVHVLWVFAILGASTLLARDGTWLLFAAAALSLIGLGFLLEGGWPGVLLWYSVYFGLRRRWLWPAVGFVHVVFGVLYASLGACLGLLLPYLTLWLPGVPWRAPGFLAWGYPLHLSSLALYLHIFL